VGVGTGSVCRIFDNEGQDGVNGRRNLVSGGRALHRGCRDLGSGVRGFVERAPDIQQREVEGMELGMEDGDGEARACSAFAAGRLREGPFEDLLISEGQLVAEMSGVRPVLALSAGAQPQGHWGQGSNRADGGIDGALPGEQGPTDLLGATGVGDIRAVLTDPLGATDVGDIRQELTKSSRSRNHKNHRSRAAQQRKQLRNDAKYNG
jgi:hypothetical protein